MMSWSGADLITQNQGIRNYELTNHLGNVLSTITDKGVITSAQDYYPFGLTLASRSFTEGGSVYRFGFNGKENDKELKQQDYGARINRPDLGRFLSVDPLTKDYPWYTPYQFAGNKPIWAIDLDGLEEYIKTYSYENGKATLLKVTKNSELREINMGSKYRNTIAKVPFDKRTNEQMSVSELGEVQYCTLTRMVNN